MKKVFISIIVVCLVLTSIFAFACSKERVAEGEYTIVAPDGAPALALASIAKNGQVTETLKIVPSIVNPTQIAAEAIKSDFAIVPANLAANLYNKDQSYMMVAAVTNGNMFFVSNKDNSNFSLNDLKGKLLYSIGQGSVPAFIMLNLLSANSIEYVESETPVAGKVAIKWVADGATMLPLIKSAGDTTVYGYLADPAVTNMVAKNIGYRVADVQDMWKSQTGSEVKGFAQACLIAKKSICDNNPEVVDAVIEALKANDSYVVEQSQDARNAIATIYPETTLPQTLVSQVVRNCNVKVLKASENVDYIMATLNAVAALKPAAVGGSVPAKDSGFYY